MEFFKGDDVEIKMYEAGKTPLLLTSQTLDEFFDEAFNAYLLGEVIHNLKVAPLSNGITKDVFATSFNSIFSSFEVAGTFETYLTVFRAIFGETVEVDFAVPGPGQLTIDISSPGTELSDFVARIIDGDSFVYDEVIDDEDDNIAFQTLKGIQSQNEAERLIYELVPAGIYAEITLTIGE